MFHAWKSVMPQQLPGGNRASGSAFSAPPRVHINLGSWDSVADDSITSNARRMNLSSGKERQAANPAPIPSAVQQHAQLDELKAQFAQIQRLAKLELGQAGAWPPFSSQEAGSSSAVSLGTGAEVMVGHEQGDHSASGEGRDPVAAALSKAARSLQGWSLGENVAHDAETARCREWKRTGENHVRQVQTDSHGSHDWMTKRSRDVATHRGDSSKNQPATGSHGSSLGPSQRQEVDVFRHYVLRRFGSPEQAFWELDSMQRNERISCVEFEDTLCRKWALCTVPKARQIFSGLDLNADGQLTLNEFCRAVQGRTGSKPASARATTGTTRSRSGGCYGARHTAERSSRNNNSSQR